MNCRATAYQIRPDPTQITSGERGLRLEGWGARRGVESHGREARILLRSRLYGTNDNKQRAAGRKLRAQQRKMRDVADLASGFRLRGRIVMMPKG